MSLFDNVNLCLKPSQIVQPSTASAVPSRSGPKLLESGRKHSGRIYEMLCRAAFKLGIARGAWVRERVYALLCRSYADELSRSRTRASATTRRCCSRSSRRRALEDDIPEKGRAPSRSWKKASPRTIIHPHAFSYALRWICPWTPTWTSTWICPWIPHGYAHGHPHGDAHQIEGKQARRFMYMNRTQHLQRPSAQEQQPECRRPE